MALRWLPVALLLPSLTLAASDLNNFDFYPKNAQQCLYDAADSAKCSGTTVKELNTCQCGNEGDFITSAATCLGQKDPDDVDSVYETMSKACSDSGTPMAVSEKDFKDAASGAASSTATESATDYPTETATDTAKDTATATKTGVMTTTTKGGKTVTVTPTPTGEDNDDGGDGLSTGAMIGIGIGAAVIGALAVMGIVFFFIRRRRRTGEESHPMLPQQNNSPYGPTTFPPTDPSPHLSAYNETKPAWAHHSQDQKPWEVPPYSAGGYVAPTQQPVQQPGTVFEMEGTTVAEGGGTGAVEMPGTIPGYQHQQHGGWPR